MRLDVGRGRVDGDRRYVVECLVGGIAEIECGIALLGLIITSFILVGLAGYHAAYAPCVRKIFSMAAPALSELPWRFGAGGLVEWQGDLA